MILNMKIERNGHSFSIGKIKKYVSMHLYEKITVSEMAENMQLNASYLNARFKKQTGESLKSYIHRCKIEEASKLLSDNSRKTSDVWTVLAYYDQSHFIRQFKRIMGTTPKQFQDYIRQKKTIE